MRVAHSANLSFGDWSASEKKIFIYLLEFSKGEMSEKSINLAYLMDECNIKNSGSFKDACESLQNACGMIRPQKSKKWHEEKVFAKFEKKDGVLNFAFSPALEGYLGESTKDKVAYSYRSIRKLSRKYSISLYEFLAYAESKEEKKIEFDLREFEDRIFLPESKRRWSLFFRDILAPSILEINLCTEKHVFSVETKSDKNGKVEKFILNSTPRKTLTGLNSVNNNGKAAKIDGSFYMNGKFYAHFKGDKMEISREYEESEFADVGRDANYKKFQELAQKGEDIISNLKYRIGK